MNHLLRVLSFAPAVAALAIPRLAAAQGAPAAQPPAGYETAAPGAPVYPAQPAQQGYPEYPAPPQVAPGYGYGYGAPVESAPLGPKRMEYNEGDPIPEGYHLDTRIRKGMVVGGFATFGGLWFISALTAAIADSVDTDTKLLPLYVPVAGPFITMATAGSRGIGTFALALDGIGQAGTLALGIAGVLAPKTQLVRNDVAFLKNVTVAPVVSHESLGLGLKGNL